MTFENGEYRLDDAADKQVTGHAPLERHQRRAARVCCGSLELQIRAYHKVRLRRWKFVLCGACCGFDHIG